MKYAVSTTTPAHDAGRPEPDDGPVVSRRAPAAGLPAVVDLALVPELGCARPAARAARGSPSPRRTRRWRRRRHRPRAREARSGRRVKSAHRVTLARPGAATGRPPPSAGSRAATSGGRRPSAPGPAYGVTGLRCSQLADRPPLLRGERHQVGVLPDGDARPCRGSPASRAGAVGHPPDDVGERDPARPGRRSTPPAAPPAARRSRPRPAPKSPSSSSFRSGVHGEWSLTTRSMSPSASAAHSASRWRPLADRRAALERRRPVGHLLRGEGQVVRAGLDGDPHALGPRPAAASAARRRRPGARRAPAPRVSTGRRDRAAPIADSSAAPRPRREEAGVARGRSARGRRR